jgi:hypothetical protein
MTKRSKFTKVIGFAGLAIGLMYSVLALTAKAASTQECSEVQCYSDQIFVEDQICNTHGGVKEFICPVPGAYIYIYECEDGTNGEYPCDLG